MFPVNVAHLGIIAVVLHGHLVGGGLCRQVEGGHPVLLPSAICLPLDVKTILVDFTFRMTPCHFNNLLLGRRPNHHQSFDQCIQPNRCTIEIISKHINTALGLSPGIVHEALCVAVARLQLTVLVLLVKVPDSVQAKGACNLVSRQHLNRSKLPQSLHIWLKPKLTLHQLQVSRNYTHNILSYFLMEEDIEAVCHVGRVPSIL